MAFSTPKSAFLAGISRQHRRFCSWPGPFGMLFGVLAAEAGTE